MKRPLTALLLLPALAFAACGGGSKTSSQSAAHTATTSAQTTSTAHTTSTGTHTSPSGTGTTPGSPAPAAYKASLKTECGDIGARLLAITNESLLARAGTGAVIRRHFTTAATEASSAAEIGARRLAALQAPSANVSEQRALISKAKATATQMASLGREVRGYGNGDLVRYRQWEKRYYSAITPMLTACGNAVRHAR